MLVVPAEEPAARLRQPIGYVETVENGRIIGWAFDPYEDGPTVVLAKLEGRVVGESPVMVSRNDIFEAGYPLVSGFEISLALPPGEYKVSVVTKRSGFELLQSPMRCVIEERGLRFCCERVGRRRVSGWVYDEDTPKTPVAIDVFLDDRLVDTIVANRPRQDIQAAYGGKCGFDWVPPLSQILGCREISLQINSTGVWLLRNAQLSKVYAHIEQAPLKEGLLQGWCVNCGNHRLRPLLRLEQGGKTVSTFCASLYREDLVRAGVGDGFHGFFEELQSESAEPLVELLHDPSGRVLYSNRPGWSQEEEPASSQEAEQ